MALVQTCSKCGREKVIDVHCSDIGMICFDCFDKHSDLNHKPDCRVSISKRIEKTQRVATLHDLVAKQQSIIIEAHNNQVALENTLREIDPCPKCQAQLKKMACQLCDGKGYKPRPTEEELAEKMPEPRY